MFRSLYAKLAAVLTGLFLVVGLIFIILTLFSAEMYQREVNQRLNRNLAHQIATQNHLMQQNRISTTALKEVFRMLMMVNPGIEIYLLDPEGNILAYSAPSGKVKRRRVDIGPIKQWLADDTALPLMGDDPRDPDGQKVFSAAALPGQGRTACYLYVILGGEAYDSVVAKLKASYILKLSLLITGAVLCFALFTGLLLFGFLTGRLKHLARVMDSFRSEGADLPALPMDATPKGRQGGDEIDRLALTFKDMTRHIQQQVARLQASDSQRRQLVANVSHDLRTPLATLQGYIETLLIKDDALSPQERKNHLETAIRHCRRLNKLVNELLELAKLEAHETRPNREPFNLGELVNDVAQKFKLHAEEKNIALTPRIKPELPLVHADIGMIERVLENLVDNAIHYTPAGGQVELEVAFAGEDVLVQVKDTGNGIPAEELATVFNRFYQLDQSRKSTYGHSGLGLAITKRILELHNRGIKVKATENTGTVFSFRLPIHTA